MVDKCNGKIATGTLSIVASAFTFVLNLLSVIEMGKDGSLNVYFYISLIFLLGVTAVLILSIVGLIRFSDEKNRQVGKASVIINLCVRGLTLLYVIFVGLLFGHFVINILTILYFLISVCLLVAFFVCNSLLPVGGKT